MKSGSRAVRMDTIMVNMWHKKDNKRIDSIKAF